MFSFNLSGWLKSWFRRKGKPFEKRPRFRPHLEALETRLAPALFVWTGAGGVGNDNWNFAANWASHTIPVAGTPENFQFDNTASYDTSNNNIAPVAGVGIIVNQMTIASVPLSNNPNPFYTLTGNPITLANGGEIITNTGAVATIGMNITFGAATSTSEIIQVQSGATLTLSGILTSSAPTQLTTQGAGFLNLTNDNPAFNASVEIDNSVGNGVVSIGKYDSLGVTGNTITVSTDTQLQVNIPSGLNPGIQNTLVLNGAGPGGTGALLDVNGNNIPQVWAGNITMDSTNGTSNTTFGVADSTGTITGTSGTTPVVVTTNSSTAGLVAGDQVRLANTVFGGNLDGQWTITAVTATTFTLVGSVAQPGLGAGWPYLPPYPTWTSPYQLTITGTVSDNNTSPYTLTKEGQGTLYLNPSNGGGNTYAGNTVINNGILQIGQPFALGPGGGTATVNTNSLESGTLALAYSATNTSIPTQYLYYNQVQTINIAAAVAGSMLELGFDGAFVSIPYVAPVAGSSAALAANIAAALNGLPTILSITPAAGPPVVTVTTPAANVFDLTFGDSLTGMEIPTISGVIISGPGTATVGSINGSQLNPVTDPSQALPIGFQVPNENLVLNGFGVQGGFEAPRDESTLYNDPAPQGEHIGALESVVGANSWEQQITLWSSVAELKASDQTNRYFNEAAVTVGAAANSNLTIDAPITDNGIGVANLYSFTKVGNGRVILTRADTFSSDIDVTAGALNVRDSNALGLDAQSLKYVWWGASLELQADGIPDSSGLAGLYNLYVPADNSLALSGPGWNGEGALDNISGVNKIEGDVLLITGAQAGPVFYPTSDGTDTDIGVDPDPDPTNIQGQTYNDLSQLTIDGVIANDVLTVFPALPVLTFGTVDGTTYLKKVGYGELVLTNSNIYNGPNTGHAATLVDGVVVPATVTSGTPVWEPQTEIAQGWITIENDQALGGTIATTDSLDPVVQVDNGAALMLKQDLNGNDLYVNYNLVLSGIGVQQPEFLNADGVPAVLQPWLNQDGALENLDGANTVTGYINLNGPAGIGVELDGANIPNPPPSQLILTAVGTSGATIMDGAAAGELIKLGSQRLIVQDPGTYTGNLGIGVDIRGGALQIESDTALGDATSAAPLETIVESGAALELAPTVPEITGGISRGLDVQFDHLFLNGTGNTSLGDAPLTILSNDNLWTGQVTLDTNLAVMFDDALGDAAMNNLTVNTSLLTGVGAGVTITSTTPGSSGINAVQSLAISSGITGGTFTLTVNDPDGVSATTAPISVLDPATGVIDIPVLIANIQTALNALAPMFGGTVAAGIALVTTSTPIIDVLPNSRFSVTGVIDDGPAAASPGDITVAGGGELVLAGANTYRGTTYVNQGILTIENSQALGLGTVSEVQTVTVTGPVGTVFTLSFTNAVGTVATTPSITYTGTALDAITIQNDLNALATIGGAGAAGAVNVTQVGNVFTITYGGSMSGFRLDNLQTNVNDLSSNNPNVVVATQTYGAGATIVASGAQLQMQGGLSVANEPLEVQGTGAPLEPEVQAVTIGSAVATGSITGAAAGSPIIITTPSTAGLTSGETVTIVGVTGNTSANGTWVITVLGPGTFSLNNSTAGAASTPSTGTWTAATQVGAFTLSFTNPNTGLTSSSTGLPVGANANQVQLALNQLVSIQQGAGTGGGSVVVNEAGSDVYTVQFEGTFALPAATNLPLIVATASAEQIITVTGTAGGGSGYTLDFTGFPAAITGNLSPTLQASGGVFVNANNPGSLENALNAVLAAPGSPGYVSAANHGTASVLATTTGNSFVIDFGGTLAGQTVPLLVPGNFQGNSNANVTASDGGTGFVTTQIQGGSANATPIQWFQVGPAPINSGQVDTTPTPIEDVTGRVTSVVPDENDPNIIYVATADGGVWKTVNADTPTATASPNSTNTTWTPLFDGVSAVQTFQVIGKSGTFNLSFTNPTNGAAGTTGTLAYNATASQVQSALNGLASVGGSGSSVLVSEIPTAGVNQVELLDMTQGGTLVGATTLGSTSITGLPSTVGLTVGMIVTDSLGNIADGATIASIVNGTTITITQGALATAAGDTFTFGAVAGSTMFTLTYGVPAAATATTAPILFTNTAADATDIANALNAATFSTIGGIGGFVTVTQVDVGLFEISFGGTLAQEPLAPFTLSAAVTSGPVSAPAVSVLTAGVLPVNTYIVNFSGGNFANQSMPALSFTSAGGATVAGGVASVAVTAPGATYTQPTVTFSAPTVAGGTQALGDVNYVGGVTGYTVTNFGTGYVFGTHPAVTITGGGGAGAVATANVTWGVQAVSPGLAGGFPLRDVFIGNPIADYSSPPTITFSAPPAGPGATTAQGYTIWDPTTQEVTGIVITNPGAGYPASGPTITMPADLFGFLPEIAFGGATIAGPLGIGGTMTGVVSSVTVVLPGLGYSSDPTVAIAAPAGGFTATAIPIRTGTITGVNILNPGSGYTAPPTVTFTGGAGSGAIATDTIGGSTIQPGLGTSAVMFSGAIAQEQGDPAVIYLGTGDSENLLDSYYGSGVYVTGDYGETWNLLVDANGFNPLAGQTVDQILVDSTVSGTVADPVIYVATSDRAVNTHQVGGGALVNVVGIWRYDTAANLWTNIATDEFNALGGDAVSNITIKQATYINNASWTSLYLAAPTIFTPNGVLYASLGTNNGGNAGTDADFVYMTENPDAPTPLWSTQANYSAPPFNNFPFVVSGTAYQELQPGAVSPVAYQPNYLAVPTPPPFILTKNGNIKISGSGDTVFAAVADSTTAGADAGDLAEYNPGGETVLEETIPGGNASGVPGNTTFNAWTPVTAPPAALAAYLDNQGGTTSAIVAASPTRFYLGGSDNGTQNFVLEANEVAGVWTWYDISLDPIGNGPHTGINSMSLDVSGRLVVGTDGGVWRWAETAPGTGIWLDMNGNLAISQVVGVATSPTNPNNILVNATNVGVAQSNGTLNWTSVDPSLGNVGAVFFDPNNAEIAYAFVNATLDVSTDGGTTWGPVIVTPANGAIPQVNQTAANGVFGTPYIVSALSVAPNTTELVLYGNDSLHGGTNLLRVDYDYVTGITTLSDLNPTNAGVAFTPTEVAISTNQGAFQADPDFPLVTDLGANNPDPATIYAANNTTIIVSKNNGLNWSVMSRTPTAANTFFPSGAGAPGLNANTIFTGLFVDPTDRDHVFAITGGAAGGQGFVGVAGESRVFVSTNAGITWTDISAGLPDSPAWSIVEDTRTGNVYLGNDLGVYELAGGALTGTNAWQRFSVGMPYVSVHTLNLNQSLNVLTAGTYGRSVYQFYLDSATSNTGGLRASSGSDIWNGPVILTAATTISANGNANLQNGIAIAQLQILGEISDLTAGAVQNTLTKIGAGNVELGGANVYAGVTVVQQGNLVADNSSALGSPGTTGAVQEIIINNGVAGSTKFLVSFNGYTLPLASAITYSGTSADAIAIQNALNAPTFLSIGGTGGSVVVTQIAPGVFTVTFGGTLVGAQPQIGAFVTVGGGSAYGSSAEVQELVFGNAVAGVTQFTLSFNGYTMPAASALTYTGTAADATAIQNALNAGAFTTIGGIGRSVVVTQVATGVFIVTFSSTFVGPQPQIEPAITQGAGAAYGSVVGGTVVTSGAALQLLANLNSSDPNIGEPLFLYGNGVDKNGHYGGALENVSNNNTYNGVITLATNSTIGTDSGSALSIVSPGGITDLRGAAGTFSLTKEGTGSLTIATADTYEGNTFVNQGDLNIQNNTALGGNNATTTVLDGAQLQLQAPTLSGIASTASNIVTGISSVAGLAIGMTVTGPGIPAGTTITGISAGPAPYSITLSNTPTFNGAGNAVNALGQSITLVVGALDVTTENLVLSGAGDPNTGGGALLNVAGNNIWGSSTTSITLASVQAFSPETTPVAAVPINVGSAGISAPGTTVLGSTTVTAFFSTAQLAVGDTVSGTGIPAGDTIAAILGATSVQLTSAATAGGTSTLTFSAPSTLTFASSVGEMQPGALPGQQGLPLAPALTMSSGLTKLGFGTLILSQADTYTGSTYVNSGILYVQNSTSLGLYPGYSVQRLTLFDQGTAGTDTFTVSFNGAANVTSVQTITGATPATAATLQAALDLLPTIGAGGVHVSENVIYSGVNEVQTLTFTNPTAATTYQLTVNGVPTLTVAYTPGTTAADLAANVAAIEAALPIPVTVTADPTDTIFTITFGGTLQDSHQSLIGVNVTSGAGTGSATITETAAGAGYPTTIFTVAFIGSALAGPQPLLVVTPSSPLLVDSVSAAASGSFGTQVLSGAAVQLDGDPLHNGSTLNVSPNETLALNGSGVGGTGALASVSGNDSWGANVILQSNSSIGAYPATQLTVTGTISDPIPAPVPPTSIVPPNLTIIGGGTVVFPNANTFTGSTVVNAGILNIQNTFSLGINASSVQALTVNGTTGTFKLFFPGYNPNSVQTSALPFNVTAAALQTAIDIMLQNPLGPGGGAVTIVNQTGTTTTLSTTVTGVSSVAGLSVGMSVSGFGIPAGTTVTGISAGPAPFSITLSAAATSSATSVLQFGNGVNVTVEPSGNTFVISFGSSTFAGILKALNVPLLYPNPNFFVGSATATTTPLLMGGESHTIVANNATLQLQGSLAANPLGKPLIINGNGFNGIGALDGVNGTSTWASSAIILGSNSSIGAGSGATMNIDTPITDQYQVQTITFTGFAAGNTYTLNFDGQNTGTLTYNAIAANNATLMTTALGNLASITLLGGTATVTSLGGNVYQVAFTGDMAGQNWPQITGSAVIGAGTVGAGIPTLISPVPGLGVNKLGVGTVVLASPTGDTYTGMTTVVAGTLQLDSAATAITNDLTVGVPTPANQAQTLTFLGANQNDLFTLTYNNGTTNPTTGNITYYLNAAYEAAQIQTALNAVLGAGFVTVAPTTPGSFLVTFVGLGATDPAFTLTGADATTVGALIASSITTHGAIYAVAGTPGAPVAQLLASNQLSTTSNVTVNNDGLFDLNGFNQTLASLTINGGITTTDLAGTTPGTLTVNVLTIIDGTLVTPSTGQVIVEQFLTMMGGTIDLLGTGSLLTLATSATVSATSDATGPADIFGAGMVALGTGGNSFTVNSSGLQPSDLVISAVITGPAGAGITETSTSANAGRLELAAEDTYPGVTTIDSGDLQVDAVFQIQFSTIPAWVNGNTFQLTYANGLQSNSTTVTYTGNAGTGANIFTQLVGLLESLGFSPAQATADVVVNMINPNLFTVAFTGLAAITNVGSGIPLTGNQIISSGTVTVGPVNDIGAVSLNQTGMPPASLSGTGSVASITSTNGTINPGSNGLTGAGVLQTSGTVTLSPAPASTFFVNPAHTSGNVTPIAGLDYDQFDVNGTVNLDNALLAGMPGLGNQLNDQFTILQATTITGAFDGIISGVTAPIAQGGTVFLNGQKFTVQYNEGGGFSPNSVVLTRVQAVIQTFTLTSSLPAGSVYGQDVTFTATVTPEPGATLATTNVTSTAAITNAAWSAATNIATITAANTFVPLQQVTITGVNLAGYNGTFTIISASATNFTYGLTTSPAGGSGPTTAGTATVQSNPIITFAVDGFETENVTVNTVTDTATFTPQDIYGPWQANSMHTITASFSDSLAVFHSATSNSVLQSVGYNTVGIAPTSTTAAPVQASGTAIYGQTVNVNATVTPTTPPNVLAIASPGTIAASNPTGNVLFQSSSIAIANPYVPITYVAPSLGTLPLGTPETATLTIQGSSLVPVGVHTITESYAGTPSAYIGDANYSASAAPVTFSLNVVQDQSVVNVTVVGTPTLGQAATFDVTVTPFLVGSIGVPHGTLTFYVDSVSSSPVGSITGYAGGTAVFTTTPNLLTKGLHTIFVTFTDTDGNYKNAAGVNAGSSGPFNVALATTTTTFGAVLPTNPTFGQAVTLTANVKQAPVINGYPLPTGLISFYDALPIGAPTLLGTGAVNQSTGQATITTPASGVGSLAVGTYTIYAVYSGDSTYSPTALPLPTLNLTIAPAVTVTTLTANPAGGITWNSPVILTADVYSAIGVVPISPATTGLGVVFFANGVPLSGVVPLVGGLETVNGNPTAVGVANFSTSALPAGNVKITAMYTDGVDGNYAVSTGTINSYPVTKAPTTVTFNAGTTASGSTAYGQLVTLSVNVTSPGGNVNVGSVKFVDTTTGVTLGTGPVSAGVATITTTALTATSHTITATYTDTTDNFFTGLSTPGSLSPFVVAAAGTSTALATSSVPTPGTGATPASGTGQLTPPVVFTATVTTTAFGSTVNPKTGNVIFKDGGSLFPNEPATGVALSGTDVATYTLKASDMTALGLHTITASYTDTPADGNFTPSTSAPLNQIVLKNSTTTVNPSSTSLFYGNPVSVNPTVVSNPAGGGNPTGSVTITDSVGGVTLYSNVPFGSGPIPLGVLSTGMHTITVTYTGDANFAASSASATINVSAAKTSVSVPPLSSSAPGSSELGESVTFTATLSVTSGGTPGLPMSGTVTFKNGATTMQPPVTLTGSSFSSGPVTVTYGANVVITYTTSTLPLSTAGQSITAIYSGGGNFAASLVSNTVVQKVLADGSLGALATTQWTVNQSFSKTIAYTEGAAGGAGHPFAASSVSSTGLPVGLNASVFNNNTIQLSGAWPTPGVYPFTLSVTDVAGVTVSKAYSITINAAPTVNTPNQGTYNTAYSSTIAITRATAPYTCLASSVPPGLTVTGATKSGTGASAIYTVTGKSFTLAGKPTTANTYTLNVTDAAGAVAPVSILINPAGTSIALNSSPKYWATGVSTSFTATVTTASGAIPLGNVSYTITNSTNTTVGSGTATLSAGKANFAFTFPATDTYTVSVNYNPTNANFAPNSTAQQQTVQKQSLLSMTSSANPATANQPVTFTAVLTGTGITETINNGGTVQFYANGALITGTVTAVPNTVTGNSVTYTITYTPTAAGTQSITVLYSGDSIFDPAVLTTPYSLSVKAGRLN